MRALTGSAGKTTSPRIGYTLWPGNFELTDPGPMLDEAEAHGVDSVELPLFCTRMVANFRPIEGVVRRFESRLGGRALEVTSHAMLTINLMDSPARLVLHEAMARTNIELSARLGARRMVLHCGLSDETGTALEDAYARQRASLARLGEHAAAHGVEICVETVWGFDGRATALPSRLAGEIEAIGHPAVRATIDFAHAALECARKGADLATEVARLAPHVHHIHVNDCFSDASTMPTALPHEALAYGIGDLHMPLGWGSLDWEGLLLDPDYPPVDLILNQELHPTFWYALGEDVLELRRLAALMAGARAERQLAAQPV